VGRDEGRGTRRSPGKILSGAVVRITWGLGRAREHKGELFENLFSEKPGITVTGMADPTLHPLVDLFPGDAAGVEFVLQFPEAGAKTADVVLDEPCMSGEDAPTEEGEPFGGLVDTALRGVHANAIGKKKLFDGEAHGRKMGLGH